MWRQEDVHHGEGTGGGEAVAQHSPAQAVGHGEHHGQHNYQAGVEEDGEAEDQGGEAQGERCTLFTEDTDQVVRQHFGTAAGFNDAAEHCAQANE